MRKLKNLIKTKLEKIAEGLFFETYTLHMSVIELVELVMLVFSIIAMKIILRSQFTGYELEVSIFIVLVLNSLWVFSWLKRVGLKENTALGMLTFLILLDITLFTLRTQLL